MRKILFVLVLLWGLHAHGEDGYKHADTRIELPKKIESFVLKEVSDYQPDLEKGVGINFSSEHAVATVFIRRLRPGHLMTAASYVDETVAATKQLEKTGMYSNVKFFKSDGKHEREGWKRAGFTARSDKGVVVSFIDCKIQDGHAIKIRITGSDPSKIDEIQKFIEATQVCVDKSSK